MTDIAYVVLSCSKFSDLWNPFFELQKRHWPEISPNIFLATDSDYREEDIPENVDVINYGKDITWSTNLLNILNHSKLSRYSYVFLMLEDCLFDNRVDNEKVTSLFQSSIDLDCAFFTLLNEPKCTEKTGPIFGRISEKSAYRTTATNALWKVEILKNLIVSNESAWQFEKNGARRSEKYRNFYSCQVNEIPIFHAVVKGKFAYGSVRKLQKLGIHVTSERGSISFLQSLLQALYKCMRYYIFILTPLSLHKYLVIKKDG